MSLFRRVFKKPLPGTEMNATKVTMLVVFISAALTYVSVTFLDRMADSQRLATLDMFQAFLVFVLFLAVIAAFTFVLLVLVMDVTQPTDRRVTHSKDPLNLDSTAEFFSIVSHQLRSPLSAIRWLAELLRSEAKERLNEKEMGYIDDIHDESKRMIGLINSLLRMTGLETGKVVLRKETVNVFSVLQGAVNDFRRQHTPTITKIVLRKPKYQLPAIVADKELLRQVFSNVVGNAIRYSKAGRGTVEISAASEDNEIIVAVKDQGIGIPAHAQQKVFEKYYRASNAIKVQTQGTGLGLYISKLILDLHGGRIWFESQEGKGSTFYIAIPIK